MGKNSRLLALLLCAFGPAVTGCATGPYEYGQFSDAKQGVNPPRLAIEHGKPNKRIDRMSDAVTWPGRKLFPEKPDKRNITDQTTDKLRTYLEENDLADVHVTVRHYAPGDEWRRLRDNRHLGFLSRYTLGTLSVLHYSILPAPVFNRNAYNPYTNTLYVNSERPGSVLREAAFAKNVRRQRLPTVYLTAEALPLVALWPECDAAKELVGYARHKDDWDLEQQAYQTVYPRIGTTAIGSAARAVPVPGIGPLLAIAGGAAGSAASRQMISHRESQRYADAYLKPGAGGTHVEQASFNEPVGTASGGTGNK